MHTSEFHSIVHPGAFTPGEKAWASGIYSVRECTIHSVARTPNGACDVVTAHIEGAAIGEDGVAPSLHKLEHEAKRAHLALNLLLLSQQKKAVHDISVKLDEAKAALSDTQERIVAAKYPVVFPHVSPQPSGDYEEFPFTAALRKIEECETEVIDADTTDHNIHRIREALEVLRRAGWTEYSIGDCLARSDSSDPHSEFVEFPVFVEKPEGSELARSVHGRLLAIVKPYIEFNPSTDSIKFPAALAPRLREFIGDDVLAAEKARRDEVLDLCDYP